MIRRPVRRLVGLSGDELLAAESFLPHQALERAARDRDTLAGEQLAHLPHPADPTAELPVEEHTADLHNQLVVAQRASR